MTVLHKKLFFNSRSVFKAPQTCFNRKYAFKQLNLVFTETFSYQKLKFFTKTYVFLPRTCDFLPKTFASLPKLVFFTKPDSQTDMRPILQQSGRKPKSYPSLKLLQQRNYKKLDYFLPLNRLPQTLLTIFNDKLERFSKKTYNLVYCLLVGTAILIRGFQ